MKLPEDLDWLLPVALGVFKRGGAVAGFTVDDLVQIGAVAAVEAEATYSPQGNSLKTWRWKQAEWAMRNAVKHVAHRHNVAPMESLDSWPGDDDPDGAPGPDLRYLMRQCLLALSKLPGPQRNLLTRIYWNGESLASIAREDGVDRFALVSAEKAALRELHGAMHGRFKGAIWQKECARARGVRPAGWSAAITIDGKKKYLGFFSTAEEAGRAYAQEARRCRMMEA